MGFSDFLKSITDTLQDNPEMAQSISQGIGAMTGQDSDYYKMGQSLGGAVKKHRKKPAGFPDDDPDYYKNQGESVGED